MITVSGAPGIYRDIVEVALACSGLVFTVARAEARSHIVIHDENAPPRRRTIVLTLPGCTGQKGAPLRLPQDATWLAASNADAALLAQRTQQPRAVGTIRWTSLEHIVDGNRTPHPLVAPSRFYAVLAALDRGTPVVVADDSPFAEYVDHNVNGLVVPASELEDAARDLVQTRRKLRALTVAQPGFMRARRDAFFESLRSRVSGKPRTVVFAHGRRPEINPRDPRHVEARGIRFQALLSRGLTVLHVPNLEELAETTHNFVFLGGRVPIDRIRAVKAATSKPIVLAMNDAIIDIPGRDNWFQDVGSLVDIVFTGEPPELLPDVKAKVFQLHQPPLNLQTPQKGTIRTSYAPMRVDPALGVVFPANNWYPRRTELVRAITTEVPMHIVGQGDPKLPNTRLSPRLRGPKYMEVMRRAVAVFSSSICNDRNITSCRLFEAAGVGAYVIAESFPGCRDMYPDDCVSWFDTPAEAVALMKTALADPKADWIMEMRQRALEHTWRRFSAHDRMEAMLWIIQTELGVW